MKLTPREQRAFSLAKVFNAMAASGLNQSSFEGEILASAAAEAGQSFDSNRAYLPLNLLARDMTSTGASGSNYLVGSEANDAADVLRALTVTGQAGITILAGLQGDQTIPRGAAASTGYWLSSESTGLTQSQAVIGQLGLTPKQAGAFVKFSRLLALQSSAEKFIRRELTNTIRDLIDGAVINGSGASGQPTGILNTSGIGAQSGTSLAWAGIVAMQKASALANAEPTAWVADPASRALLQQREKAAGSGLVWDDGRVSGTPAFATTAVPSATLLTGDWSQAVLAFWGDGVNVEIDPSTGFRSGVFGARVLAAVDVGIVHPAAFTAATSIT